MISISKKCMQCKKDVPLTTRVGDICPHCGVRFGEENVTTTYHRQSIDWRKVLKIILILSPVALVLAVLMLLVAGRQRSVAQPILTQLQGAPGERLSAARLLTEKPRSFVMQIAPDYIKAMQSSDGATRVALIRALVDVEMGLRNQQSGGTLPILPGNLVIMVRSMENDPDPEVRKAVKDTLRAIGDAFTANPSPPTR